MTRYLGCHVSVAGGLEHALVTAQTLGVNAIQIHPSAPQRWNYKPFPKGVEDKYLKLLPDSGVVQVFFHAIYLINLANPDPAKVNNAKQSLIHYLDLAERMGAQGVIFHTGSAKEQPSMEVALIQAAEAVSEILEKANPRKAKLLLEVAAGSGSVIGARFEELREIFDRVPNKQQLGFALDTQHMWASGYDVAFKSVDVLQQIESVFGIENVHAIHVNDSKSDLASKVDRHDNVGSGKIGSGGLKNFLGMKEFAQIPMILETPGLKSVETAASEVQALKGLFE